MGETTSIQWTDHTFNPWWGCVKVSPGCEHCYAESLSKRFGKDIWGPAKTTHRQVTGSDNWRAPYKWNREAEKAGRVDLVFCASMGDVFEDHPELDQPRSDLFYVMAQTRSLAWQVLTKRPENVLDMVPRYWLKAWPANVWIGTSVEDQKRADERIPELLKVPAAVRFLSCEPLLERVDLSRWFWPERYLPDTMPTDVRWGLSLHVHPGIHWVIIGGESGAKARGMAPNWALDLTLRCHAAGVPVFVKQLGTVAARDLGLKHHKGGDIDEWPLPLQVREFPEGVHA